LAHFGISLEALLIGHEGKLTNVHFSPSQLYESPRLLSTAADNSMIIWAPEAQGQGVNTIWLPKQRFGELGAGRSLGMFGALWSTSDRAARSDVSVITNSWSGGLQRWRQSSDDPDEEQWVSEIAPTGHALAVEDLAWDPSSSYLLSVSTDQTSRVHAQCRSKTEGSTVWGELGRPQVHGYDLTCVAFLDRLRFASGADEKVVRVFDAPKGFAASLYGLGVTQEDLTEVSRAVMQAYTRS
jgi:elongator complex protein 2